MSNVSGRRRGQNNKMIIPNIIINLSVILFCLCGIAGFIILTCTLWCKAIDKYLLTKKITELFYQFMWEHREKK